MDMNSVLDLKPFLPAEDYALAKQFYLDLGFTMVWGSEELTCFQVGKFRFLLQNYYAKEWAGNFVMHLMVKDADDWWKHIREIKLTEKYSDIMAKPPTLQRWGLRVLYLSDPSGVLWHIADDKT
jgi:alpha-glucosidase (family GH31 glycosyl hydrolase)